MPFRNFIMGAVVFAYLFNGGLIPWFLVIRKLGMLNSLWALIIPQALPLWNVILMMNFFRRVPKELEEASIIDGAHLLADPVARVSADLDPGAGHADSFRRGRPLERLVPTA